MNVKRFRRGRKLCGPRRAGGAGENFLTIEENFGRVGGEAGRRSNMDDTRITVEVAGWGGLVEPELHFWPEPSSAGVIQRDGVTFAHGRGGVWVVRFSALKRMYYAACKVRGKKP